MRNGHTDAEMLIATQIAYLNIEPDDHPVNVAEWMASHKASLENAARNGGLNPADQAQLDTINNIYNMMSRSEYNNIDLSRWNVIDARNHNTCGGLEENGMYASLIDTGNGDAIIGFRGSESYDSAQKVHDWGESDFGLHNRYETLQQQDAEDYMSWIYNEYGEEYRSFDVTGHSLGGNLAEHATLNAPEAMRDKIGRCVNFDGPGFSNEYILGHALEIAAMSDKVDHYAWSTIGALLFPIPGSHYQVIDARTPSEYGDIRDEFYRHATDNVRIVDGHVVPGERDPLASGLSDSSKIIELVDNPMMPPSLRIALIIGVLAGGFLQWVYHEITDASAEFSVDTMALNEAADMLGSTAETIHGIADEVLAVTESIEYYSGSAMICRLKLRNLARIIEGDSSGAYALSYAMTECASEYISSDRCAASHLAV